MKINKIIYQIILIFFIFTVIINWTGSVKMPTNLLYGVGVFVILGLVPLVVKRIIKFFTLPVNFITKVLGHGILNAAILYGLELLWPGFRVMGISVSKEQLGFVIIKSFVISPVFGVIVLGFALALVYNILDYLNKSE